MPVFAAPFTIQRPFRHRRIVSGTVCDTWTYEYAAGRVVPFVASASSAFHVSGVAMPSGVRP